MTGTAEPKTADRRQQTITVLTMIIVGLWIISAVMRIFVPWPAASVLDAVMPLVIGYYFVTKRDG